MQYGVLSDIHGNWEAFQAVLRYLHQAGVERYLFCGDLVGYGPDPEACVQQYLQLKAAGQICGVMGNHDAILVHPELQECFNPEALHSLDWSLQQLSKSSTQAISYLPKMVQEKKFALVHGTPRDPIKEYFVTEDQFWEMYNTWQGQVLFVGHTHLPFIMQGDLQQCQVELVEQPSCFELQDPWRYVINPGSVGKPRDEDVRASFGIWDSEKHTFSFLRLPYDFLVTQTKLKAAGLPDLLADNLS